MRGRGLKKSPDMKALRRDSTLGFLQGLGLNIAVWLGAFLIWGLFGINLRGQTETVFAWMAFLFGLVQLIYMLPLLLILKNAGRPAAYLKGWGLAILTTALIDVTLVLEVMYMNAQF